MFTHSVRRHAVCWLLLYFVLWTVLPFMLSASYPLDVPEGIYWGHEWQWGYYKHPPLSSWVLFTFYRVFGHIGPYLLSQLTIALTLWLVYRLGCLLMTRQRALVGSVLVMAVFYYTWPSLEFNHNIAQMPVWAGLVYVFYLASRQNRWWQWLLFGVLAGAGMLVKYPVAILLLVIMGYSLATPYRRLWLSPKPWVALILALAIFAPNVWWLAQNDWLPFTYAENRASEAVSRGGRFSGLSFLVTQLLNHAPLLLILLCARVRLRCHKTFTPDQVFLLTMGLAPALLLVLVSLFTGLGLRDMWGMPMWGLSGLLVVMWLPDAVFDGKARMLLKGVSVWLVLATLAMALYVEFGGRIRHKPSRMDWPQAALAQHVSTQWHAVSRCRLDSISGDKWLSSLAAAYVPDDASVMIAGKPAYSPWITPARLRQHGSIAVWAGDKPPFMPLFGALAADRQMVMYQGQWLLPWAKVPQKAPLLVHWRAFVPAGCLKTAARSNGD